MCVCVCQGVGCVSGVDVCSGGCWGWMCVSSPCLWSGLGGGGGGGAVMCLGWIVCVCVCVCEVVMLDVGGFVSYVPCKGTVTQVVGVLSTVVKW